MPKQRSGPAWQRVGPVVALLVFVGVVVAILVTREPSTPTTERAAEIEGVVTFTVESRDHVEGAVEYAQSPSVGGAHSQVWTNCGAYDEPVVEEQVTHSLEHGAVWIAYDPQLGADDIDRLRTLVDDAAFAILSPREAMPSAVVASAWGTQLRVADVSDDRLATFLEEYQQGPQTPELGAPCTGGTDG